MRVPGSAAAGAADPAGFTLVEVLIAILVLLVGVLGTVSLVDGANRTTTNNTARQGGINLARDIVEAAHALSYSNIPPTGAVAALQGQPGLGDDDPSKAGWQIKRRGFTFTVTATVCYLDGPADGFAASHDASFCSGSQSASAGGKVDSQPIDYNRLDLANNPEPGR